MNLLIVGDSHCRDMDTDIHNYHPNMNIMIVTKSRGIPAITRRYNASIRDITNFMPNIVVIHCGHNDIMRHPKHNRHPIFITAAIRLQVQLATTIRTDFPNATILCSAVFPRTWKQAGRLTKEETTSYNWMAKRYGQRLRSECLANNLLFTFNMIMWAKISKAVEVPKYYLSDGLHLDTNGRIIIGQCWIDEIIHHP